MDKARGKARSKGSILVICSHSDDQVLGVGGAIAKYADEGYDIHTVVMSFGESFKPHMRREIISKTRIKESQRADKILGGRGVIFLGLKEMRFEDDFDKRGISKNFKNIIASYPFHQGFGNSMSFFGFNRGNESYTLERGKIIGNGSLFFHHECLWA